MSALDVVVIGAGQAGLSAAYHLVKAGLRPHEDFVVLDANPGPGGAWRHRWPSLTFGTAHGIHDLPGLPLGTPDPAEPASSVVTRYYGEYEARFSLPVIRPARVFSVVSESDADDAALLVHTDAGTFSTRYLINATGTWDKPFWPWYPGRSEFRGRQLHTRDFWSASEFAGQHVVVVGGGTSAVQFLLQLNQAGATTTWATRREPVFEPRSFDSEWGRDVERRVRERTGAGLPPESVVSVTGLPLTPQYQRGIDQGILVSAGPMTSLTPDGVLLATGEEVHADAVLWATGFRASIDHLGPLQLRERGGGIRTEGVRVDADPRVFLVGYGSSASTLGATRAGRTVARDVVRTLKAAGHRELVH